MSVMMLAFSISQTAGPIIAATKTASAAADFFAIINAPSTYISSPAIVSGACGDIQIPCSPNAPRILGQLRGSDHTIVPEVVGYPKLPDQAILIR